MVKNCSLRLTHTPKCPKRIRVLPGVFAAFSALHDLCHKISHRLCRPILLLPCGVGVGSEGEPCIVVPQHTADGFHVYSILESQRRECVPLWHNKDKSDKPLRCNGLAVCLYSFST